MVAIDQTNPHKTFINLFRTRSDTQHQVVDILIRISDEVASTFPGFRSASTHASDDGKLVMNYLQWESQEALQRMQRSHQFQNLAQGFYGLIENFEEFPSSIQHVAEAGPS